MYKRQADILHQADVEAGAVCTDGGGVLCHLAVQLLVGAAVDGIDAVSYTHLDVYKRQAAGGVGLAGIVLQQHTAAHDRHIGGIALYEPLYLDVKDCFYGTENAPVIVGGRYGLGSKDTTPAQICLLYTSRCV